jgi:hypothetical protein
MAGIPQPPDVMMGPAAEPIMSVLFVCTGNFDPHQARERRARSAR